MMPHRFFVLQFLVGALIFSASPCPAADAGQGPKDAIILVIRHAEKPGDGDGLTPAGEARARAYVGFFQNFKFHSDPVKLDAIYAAADSKNSRRPRITVEPLAQAVGLKVNTEFKDKEYLRLANELQAHLAGKNALVCWHHGAMIELLQALGADPVALLPGGRWPGDAYDWLIILRYDHEGRLKDAQRIDEGLAVSRPHAD